MELAFAAPTGFSRFWGAGGKPLPQHAFGRRTMTEEELLAVSGGDDGGDGGGDCGAGGDCGSDSGSCGGSDCATPADPSNTISFPTVTVIGIAPNPAVPSVGDASAATAFGSLLGGAAGAVAFGTGAAGMMGLGDAIALGTILGGIVAIATMGIVITGLALLALLANYAQTHPGESGQLGNPMGDPTPGFGGGDGP